MTHIPGHLAGESMQDMAARYAAVGKALPRHYGETVPGQVTVSVPADPTIAPVTYAEPVGQSLVPASAMFTATNAAAAPKIARDRTNIYNTPSLIRVLNRDLEGAIDPLWQISRQS